MFYPFSLSITGSKVPVPPDTHQDIAHFRLEISGHIKGGVKSSRKSLFTAITDTPGIYQMFCKFFTEDLPIKFLFTPNSPRCQNSIIISRIKRITNNAILVDVLLEHPSLCVGFLQAISSDGIFKELQKKLAKSSQIRLDNLTPDMFQYVKIKKTKFEMNRGEMKKWILRFGTSTSMSKV